MKYLTIFTVVLFMSVVNAETVTTAPTADTSTEKNTESIKQATQSVARKLISLLDLKTIPTSEQATISLKDVVLKALQEGKPMSEIRSATNQAVSEVTQKASPAETALIEKQEPVEASVAGEVAPSTGEVVPNPAEVTLDPETGKMIATVLPGESIFRLAQRVYGKENGRKYIQIFAANTDKIKDINVVVEGQQLVMP
jgi:nucleoid-associated protein YgaU